MDISSGYKTNCDGKHWEKGLYCDTRLLRSTDWDGAEPTDYRSVGANA